MPRTILGLDLGQAQDFSALAVAQESGADEAGKPLWSVPLLKRWQLGTSYLDIVADVGRIAGTLAIYVTAVPTLPELAVDATGVGRAVVDILRQALLPVSRLVAITITGGSAVTQTSLNAWNVAKKDLVAAVQAPLQQRRLKVARSIAEAEALQRELQMFKVKITAAANESFEAWRERDHDDLVLAVAIALWLGERKKREFKWW